jgi:hypothetical protein
MSRLTGTEAANVVGGVILDEDFVATSAAEAALCNRQQLSTVIGE